ncbi:hypothetical protein [Thermovibrio sp.]
MKGLSTKLFIVAVSLSLTFPLSGYSQEAVQKKEAVKEIEKLAKLKAEVKELLKKNREVLREIKKEREELKREREEFERRVKEVEAERYKRLAEFFEKMDPELAGQKISQLTDPKEAAYIIYNMKPRKAGEVLNYVSPQMVNKIVEILTQIKKSSDGSRSSQES